MLIKDIQHFKQDGIFAKRYRKALHTAKGGEFFFTVKSSSADPMFQGEPVLLLSFPGKPVERSLIRALINKSQMVHGRYEGGGGLKVITLLPLEDINVPRMRRLIIAFAKKMGVRAITPRQIRIRTPDQVRTLRARRGRRIQRRTTRMLSRKTRHQTASALLYQRVHTAREWFRRAKGHKKNRKALKQIIAQPLVHPPVEPTPPWLHTSLPEDQDPFFAARARARQSAEQDAIARRDVHVCRQAIDQLQAHLTLSKHAPAMLDTLLQDLQQQHDQATSLLEAKHSEADQAALLEEIRTFMLERSPDDVSGPIRDLQQQEAALATLLHDHRQQVSASFQQVQRLSEPADDPSLQQKRSGLKLLLDGLQIQMAELRIRHEVLRQQQSALQKRIQKLKQSRRHPRRLASARKKRAALREALEATRHEWEQMESDRLPILRKYEEIAPIEAKKRIRNRTEFKLDQHEQQLDRLNERHQALVWDFDNGQISEEEFLPQLEHLQQKITHQTRTVADLQAEVNDINQQIANLKMLRADTLRYNQEQYQRYCEAQLTRSQRALARLELEERLCVAKSDTFEENLCQIIEVDLSFSLDDFVESRAARDLLRQKTNTQNNRVEDLERTINQLRADHMGLQQRLANAHKDGDRTRIETLTPEVSALGRTLLEQMSARADLQRARRQTQTVLLAAEEMCEHQHQELMATASASAACEVLLNAHRDASMLLLHIKETKVKEQQNVEAFQTYQETREKESRIQSLLDDCREILSDPRLTHLGAQLRFKKIPFTRKRILTRATSILSAPEVQARVQHIDEETARDNAERGPGDKLPLLSAQLQRLAGNIIELEAFGAPASVIQGVWNQVPEGLRPPERSVAEQNYRDLMEQLKTEQREPVSVKPLRSEDKTFRDRLAEADQQMGAPPEVSAIDRLAGLLHDLEGSPARATLLEQLHEIEAIDPVEEQEESPESVLRLVQAQLDQAGARVQKGVKRVNQGLDMADKALEPVETAMDTLKKLSKMFEILPQPVRTALSAAIVSLDALHGGARVNTKVAGAIGRSIRTKLDPIERLMAMEDLAESIKLLVRQGARTGFGFLKMALPLLSSLASAVGVGRQLFAGFRRVIQAAEDGRLLKESIEIDSRLSAQVFQSMMREGELAMRHGIDAALQGTDGVGALALNAGALSAGADHGVAVGIGGGILFAGTLIQYANRVVFTIKSWSMAAYSWHLIRRARAGDRAARVELMRFSGMHAKGILAIRAQQNDPVAVRYIKTHGLTPEMIEASSPKIIRAYLLRRSKEPDFDHSPGKMERLQGALRVVQRSAAWLDEMKTSLVDRRRIRDGKAYAQTPLPVSLPELGRFVQALSTLQDQAPRLDPDDEETAMIRETLARTQAKAVALQQQLVQRVEDLHTRLELTLDVGAQDAAARSARVQQALAVSWAALDRLSAVL